jgi:hypothetical protein
MLSLILKLIQARGLVRTIGDAARVAKSAREIASEFRPGDRRALPPASDHALREKLLADLARLDVQVTEHTRALEQVAVRLEQLTADVRRATQQATVGLLAGLLALVLAIVALARS